MIWRLARSLRALLVAALTASGFAACSGPTGLVAVGEPGEVCVPASIDGEATVGLDVLENTSSGPVEVTGASVVDQKGLDVVGWSVVEPGSDSAVVASGFVNSTSENSTAVISAGKRMILVLGLRLERAPGTSEGVYVTYDQSGREAVTRTVISLRVVPAGQVCN